MHKEKRTLWKPMAVVLLVLTACLFPVWPFFARLAVFYICFYLLIAILVFCIFRFFVYSVLRVFGFEFWLLPDIFDKVG